MQARFAGFLLDTASRQLTRGGQSCPLSPKAFTLLEALLEAHPAAVSKEALYEILWPSVFVEPGNLHNLVAEVRNALGDQERQIVRTAQRFGYALTAPVARDEKSSRYRLVLGHHVVALKEGKNLIGRDPEAEIHIDSSSVSRHHAVITVNEEVVEIDDLGSKNGTHIGGRRLETAARLQDGDEILLGRVHALFRAMPLDGTTESINETRRPASRP